DKPHSPKAAKKKGKLERLRDALAKANATNSQKTARTEKQVSTPDRDKRIPDSEWKAITRAMRAAGFAVLPPIEIECNDEVQFSVDITSEDVIQHLRMLITEGYVFYAHFGTPCSSFSLARKLDGGPPPLRSKDFLWGLPHLKPWDDQKVKIGNQLMQLTVDLVTRLQSVGCLWSIENPLSSFLWLMPPMVQLTKLPLAVRTEFDMCRFGSAPETHRHFGHSGTRSSCTSL
ncbi:unnamed protein product, partial [Durusdinium trenchii]